MAAFHVSSLREERVVTVELGGPSEATGKFGER
jgi:hypothetical protein